MRGHPGPPAGAASLGASSATTTSSAVSRLPPAGIWAVRPHLQRTVTNSLFMESLKGKTRGNTLYDMVRDGMRPVTYFLIRRSGKNLSRRRVLVKMGCIALGHTGGGRCHAPCQPVMRCHNELGMVWRRRLATVLPGAHFIHLVAAFHLGQAHPISEMG